MSPSNGEPAKAHKEGEESPPPLQSPEGIAQSLQIHLDAGLLIATGSIEGTATYAFAHDSVAEAALNSIPDTTLLVPLQLLIGRHLLASLPKRAAVTNLFQALDPCNQQLSLIPKEEQLQMVAHYLEAGEISKRQSAFASARLYFETGLKLLKGAVDDKDYWQSHSKTAVRLHVGCGSVAYICGDPDQMELHFQQVLEQPHIALEDKVPVFCTKLEALEALERYEEGLELSCSVLSKLGVSIPTNPSKVTVVVELLKTVRLSKKYSRAALLKLPLMQDKRKLLATDIMDKMATLSYEARPNQWIVLNFKAIRFCIKHGIHKYSPGVLSG